MFLTGRTASCANRGQIRVIYTDGLWEVTDPDGESYGKHLLKECVRRGAHLDVETSIEKILEDQEGFRRTRRNDDDITLVVIKRVPES